ncbi:hypothetical protein AQUCO_01900098v1 [Aquilegia coerulea]|uniref:GCF C-terminal domain-containing protein n=1 Tax=Aquilegia coerulea TaxID=218851 RepID=A0A2G5DIY2_AQUCA|nr:hypothetical protein AQUCO_01900098v1 [Aquilegia coerulea]
MSGRNKNFRSRVRHADDDDDTPSTTTTPTTVNVNTTTTKTTNTSSTITKPPRKLSFADEEEEQEESPFTSIRRSSTKKSDRKKSSLSSSSSSHTHKSSSHKLSSTKERFSTTTPIPSSFSSSSSLFLSNVQPQAGEYTKEKLRELEKNTPSLARSRPPPPPPSSDEPLFILKGPLKPLQSSSVQQDDVEEEEEEEEGELDERDGRRGISFDDTENKLASMGIDKIRDYDPAQIEEIRAKRERLRKSKAAAPDFISLDGGSNHGAAEGLSDEEPEFQGRISLFGDNKKDGDKKGVFEIVDAIDIGVVDKRKNVKLAMEMDDDEDEEDKIWEEEQFRKGLGKRIDDGANMLLSSNVSMTNHTLQQQTYAYPQSAYQLTPTTNASIGPMIGGAIGVSRSAEVMSISQQSEVACQSMQDNIRRLQESHARTISSMTRVEENLSGSLSNITALEKSLEAGGEKFIFMQKLRDFVSVICDFLQDKAPFLEELEEQMQKLQEDRASATVERRAADDADEKMEIEPAVRAAMLVLNKGGTNVEITAAAAAAAAQAASAAVKDQSNLPVQLDELGRDLNLQKRMDMIRRAEARKRRKAKADLRRAPSVGDDNAYHHVEGESSTDESDSESTSYQSNRHELLQTAALIFSDASDKYSQLSVVKERFERWKKIYSSSYRDAYMSLSAPAIFSPYAFIIV